MSKISEAPGRNIKHLKREQEKLIYIVDERKSTENKISELDS